jgi:plasmid stabilization system protein ParE
VTLTPAALSAVLSIGRTLERTRGKAHAEGWVQALLDGVQSGFITEVDGEPVREVAEPVKCVQEVMF